MYYNRHSPNGLTPGVLASGEMDCLGFCLRFWSSDKNSKKQKAKGEVRKGRSVCACVCVHGGVCVLRGVEEDGLQVSQFYNHTSTG